ncbi:DUF1223 domain-containing protein [Winogradskyella flava]|uniref:DUF1223 domain-containing protein n=1 Tax=Winogradskyella flava TaxID=1884876 RepID=A0A842IU67_9FLAO|nr:DUF1223 domain-containing protein [Winogradskyella flava]MBC2845273.1 DUF1223 domain-containing protein [Winogradskyella flava]
MKSVVLTLFIIPVIFFSSLNNKTQASDNIVVLELFTSQGCSSCPPADKYLDEVKSDKVIALSYHVDYWDYIGWKDPFSKSTYAEKQSLYATKFNSSTIYTPQLVINGKEHIVGSDKRLVHRKIAEYSKKSNDNKVQLSNVSKSESLVRFGYTVDGEIKDKYIRTVLVINERKTSVKRGENRNKELINTNIVVNELRFKLKDNSGLGSITLPKIITDKDELSLILIIENKTFDILGAAQKAL